MLMLYSSAALYVAGLEPQAAGRGVAGKRLDFEGSFCHFSNPRSMCLLFIFPCLLPATLTQPV